MHSELNQLSDKVIDKVDNFLSIAKCDAIQEIFSKMNVKYLDTETILDYLEDV